MQVKTRKKNIFKDNEKGAANLPRKRSEKV